MLKFLKKLEEKPIDTLVLRLFTTWCFTALGFLIAAEDVFSSIKAFSGYSIIHFAITFAVVFGIITLISVLKKKSYDRKLLPVSFALYAFSVTMQSQGNFFVGMCFAAMAIIMLLYYYKTSGLHLKKPFTTKKRNIYIIAAVAVFVLVCGSVGVFRYVDFLAPNYDFGIFCQMFHNMRESFSPVTTCERDKLLSHFAVHMSPIYYLLLPFYFVFPSPVTLQIGQTAVLASAAAPVYLLCRHYKLSDIKTACVVAVTLFQPAVMSGTFYDLHENCFLFPLLLWVFWAFEREKYAFLAVFTLLTLCVKEDAAIYIVFFAIFVILNRKKYLTGAAMTVVAVVWFVAVTAYLAKYGDGVMTNRYGNYLSGEGTLFDVVKNVLVNPAYVFTQLFTDDKGEYGPKLLFFLQMGAPLAFLPFVTKKVSRLLLLLPVVLINFMTVYPYQYQINFQYSFGSAAFLTFLMIMNLADLKPNAQKLFSCIALICSATLFITVGVSAVRKYVSQYVNFGGDTVVMREALADIPSDKSVCSSTYLMPHLSKRSVLYEVYYHVPADGEVLDYIILDSRFDCSKDIEKYEKLGYAVTRTVTGSDGNKLITFMEPTEKADKVSAAEAETAVNDGSQSSGHPENGGLASARQEGADTDA